MNKTLDYYDNNAKAFAENTFNIVFSEIQDMFLEHLKYGASVLDFGCGSGRDTKYFLEKGFQVAAVDGSAELCRIAREKTGLSVMQMDFLILMNRTDMTGYGHVHPSCICRSRNLKGF